jgi:DNA end-binding protein Ku
VKSVWTGAITLSLLNCPVKLAGAAKDNQLDLHMVRKSDGSRVKYQYVSERDGKEVAWHESAKGWDAPDGSLVILDKSDFEKAFGEKNRAAKLTMFTDAANIPPLAAKSAYWVQPDGPIGEKIYALIAHALQASGKVGIVTFAMRQRVAVAVLRAHDGYLSLEPMEWYADMLWPDFAAPPNTATEAEEDLARDLIESMTRKYDHAAQADPSREALEKVIAEKIESGRVIAAPPRPDNAGAPADLASALQAAVESAKSAAAPKPKRAPRARKAAAA